MANQQRFKVIVSAMVTVIALSSIICRLTHKSPATSNKGVDRIIGIKLGESFSNYLPEKGKIMVFISEGQGSYVQGLEEGVSAKEMIIAKLEIESEEVMFPEGNYEDELSEFYNRQISKHPDVSGLVFFSQFPREVRKLNVFSEKSPPKIALLTSMSPEISALIKQDYVQTVVAGTPEVHTLEKGERIPPEKIFQQRFMIVTPDNVGKVIRKYPRYAP